MMKVTLDMPQVASCSVEDCTYNKQRSCHARAITVGDGRRPGCDTYFNNGSHCQNSRIAGVGACKVDVCRHNRDFECQASEIEVGYAGQDVLCLTFAER